MASGWVLLAPTWTELWCCCPLQENRACPLWSSLATRNLTDDVARRAWRTGSSEECAYKQRLKDVAFGAATLLPGRPGSTGSALRWSSNSTIGPEPSLALSLSMSRTITQSQMPKVTQSQAELLSRRFERFHVWALSQLSHYIPHFPSLRSSPWMNWVGWSVKVSWPTEPLRGSSLPCADLDPENPSICESRLGQVQYNSAFHLSVWLGSMKRLELNPNSFAMSPRVWYLVHV